MTDEYLAVVGSDAPAGDPSLRTFRVEADTGRLAPAGGTAATGRRTIYATAGPDGEYLYAVDAADDGTVGAFRYDGTGALTPLNRRSTGGETPCYCSVDAAGEYCFVANFNGGSIALLPIGADGHLGTATDVVDLPEPGEDDRGREPHAAVPGPNDRLLYVPDRGADVVAVYEIDRETNRLRPSDVGQIEVQEGAGPRHLRFDEQARRGYLVGEHDSTLVTFERTDDGALEQCSTVPTLPAAYDGENHAADLRIHPEGDRLYVSNREHDSIAVFRIDEDGIPEPTDHVDSGGAWPWGLSLTPEGTYCYAANEESDRVSVFSVGQRSLASTDQGADVPAPLFVAVL